MNNKFAFILFTLILTVLSIVSFWLLFTFKLHLIFKIILWPLATFWGFIGVQAWNRLLNGRY
jgi:hypothetical protein